ncbi:MAG: VTT domain-containing protein [Candidatus Cohnella colombiensis]|uniref:TVP38/TMEM64 family membrane protein n=1 Tax=Candidatus Cohnella colombiensis TaxID=3121368 RepID=A0AA95F0C6_9BACL|nr:MAG: VTT domain-containing protein [Cohnella sp.]
MALLKKIWLFTVYAIAAWLLIINRKPLIGWMESESYWQQNILIVLIGLIIAIVPAIPYGLMAAVLGAKFGPVTGTILNVFISAGAAMILFLLIRHTFSAEGRARAAKMKGIRYLTDYTERNAFFSIFFARTIPIVPAQAVNIFAAVTQISWVPYLLATVLGKIPFIVMVTLLGDRFFQNADLGQMMIITGPYGIFIMLVFAGYRFFQKYQSR